MIQTFRHATPGRIVRTGVKFAAVVGLGLVLSGPASSQSITPASVDPVQHFLDCLGAMVSDPAAHAAECSPGHTVTVSGSTGYAAAPSNPDDDDDVCVPDDDCGA